MKRYNSLKKIGAAALSLLLLLALAAPALAAESEDSFVTFYGRTRLFEFDPEDGSSTGLFNNLQGLMPGGTYTQEITVKNEYSRRTDIYLRGESKGVSSPGQKDIDDLLDLIEFRLLDEDGVIVGKGSLSRTWPASGGTTHRGYRYIDLGRFYEDDEETLTLELTVPADLNNDYQNAKGTVEWTFLANVYEPDDDDDDDDPRIPLGPGPIITINENQIPLAPGTGDDANLYLWGGLFVIFAVLLAVLLVHKRRRRA